METFSGTFSATTFQQSNAAYFNASALENHLELGRVFQCIGVGHAHRGQIVMFEIVLVF